MKNFQELPNQDPEELELVTTQTTNTNSITNSIAVLREAFMLSLRRPAINNRDNALSNFLRLAAASTSGIGVFILGGLYTLSFTEGNLIPNAIEEIIFIACGGLFSSSVLSGGALFAINLPQAMRNRGFLNQNQTTNNIGGFHDSILPNLLQKGPTSFLIESSETIISSLKTVQNSQISSADVVSFLNYLFTPNHKPLNEILVQNLTENSIGASQASISDLFNHRLDYKLNQNEQGARIASPITDDALIQVFAYVHLVGILKEARNSESELNLPNVDLEGLTQKYQSFYNKFSTHCQEKYGNNGREFAENLGRKLNYFATTGQDFSLDQDLEAAVVGFGTATRIGSRILENTITQNQNEDPKSSFQPEKITKVTAPESKIIASNSLG